MKTRRDIFQAVADPTRRTIILLLAAQPLTAGAIASHFDSARPTISKHIKVLSECELLQSEQDGRNIYYKLDATQMDVIDEWVEEIRTVWKSRFSKLDNVLNKLSSNE